jgi:uncharacterized membrane protein
MSSSTSRTPRSLRWAALLRGLRARPRLLWSVAAGAAVYVVAAATLTVPAAAVALIAWNTGALLYLGLAWDAMHRTDVEGIRERALGQDEGALAILVLVVLAAAAVLLAVGSQLAAVKGMHGWARAAHIAVAGLTVVTAWFFTQVLFALHYAHDFYIARIRGAADPLQFPGTPDPGYADFFYFSCVIGTSAQTADVSFTTSSVRPVGTLHCIVAFFFNATLLALSINIVAGLL